MEIVGLDSLHCFMVMDWMDGQLFVVIWIMNLKVLEDSCMKSYLDLVLLCLVLFCIHLTFLFHFNILDSDVFVLFYIHLTYDFHARFWIKLTYIFHAIF